MANFQNSMQDLIEAWRDSPYPSIKMTAYFPAYTELFSGLRGRECTFIETGVLNGGSLFMWRKWLGPKARIIGIDLNPQAKKWTDHGFEIFIGDQGDPEFWRNALAAIGPFDVLLDDGGHQSFQQIVTVRGAIAASSGPCLVVVEDTAANFMKDFSAHGHYSFLEYAKDATDLITGRSFPMYPADRFPASVNLDRVREFLHVYSVQFFNGIVAFKVNQRLCPESKVVRNRSSENPATDFRYEGKNQAQIEWPSLFDQKQVCVKGGRNSVEIQE